MDTILEQQLYKLLNDKENSVTGKEMLNLLKKTPEPIDSKNATPKFLGGLFGNGFNTKSKNFCGVILKTDTGTLEGSNEVSVLLCKEKRGGFLTIPTFAATISIPGDNAGDLLDNLHNTYHGIFEMFYDVKIHSFENGGFFTKSANIWSLIYTQDDWDGPAVKPASRVSSVIDGLEWVDLKKLMYDDDYSEAHYFGSDTVRILAGIIYFSKI